MSMVCRITHPPQRLVFSAVLILAAGASVAGGGAPRVRDAAAQTLARKTNNPSGASSEMAVPFRIGEKLEYRVAWATFTSAASLELSVPERRDLMGLRTWHLRATAHTLSPMRSFVLIDDQFDSYTDVGTLESRQYETYLNEMGTRQNQIFHLVPEGQAPSGNGAAVVVSRGTRDPLGAAYVLRGVDWQHTSEVKMPVFDGRDLYEMRARLDVPSETVAVAAGNFSATKISIRLFQHGREVSGMNFVAWLANDTARTPVLLEAEMPLGSVRVELVSASQ
jgi:Protein of unknown function (DUF3108)